MKRKRLAVIGFGGRGQIYGGYAKEFPDQFEFIAAVDNDILKLEKAKLDYGVKHLFSDYNDFLKAGLDLDIVAISTQDASHREHAVACLQHGYDLLLEKPIATSVEDCLEILKYSQQFNRKVIVCHVLRYSPFYDKVKEIIDSNILGEIMTINASENIGYYHYSHSYVRGPWRSSAKSSPIILAKCCHDLDIIRYLINKPCLSVNSLGDLTYFKKENAPEGSSEYCSDCALKDSCAFNAQRLYTKYRWMAGYFLKGNNSDADIFKDLKYSNYDRCVYKSDNDVADHQVTIMNFEGGITASLTMSAFSKEIYRDIKIHGTKAELVGIMEDNFLEIRPYQGEVINIPIDISEAVYGGHNGGDYFMMNELHKELNGIKSSRISYLDVSVESHLMAFAAEKSRLDGGSIQFIKM